MKTVITEENFWANHFLVEAIYKGFHVRIEIDGVTILSAYNPDDYDWIRNRLMGASVSFPDGLNVKKRVDNLVKYIESQPNSKIIEKNEFDMQYYPQNGIES
jgi:hypothetical protein